MKKYELLQTGRTFWELYFLDREFDQYVFIKGFDHKTPIKDIYDYIKNNNKNNNCNILVKFTFQK